MRHQGAVHEGQQRQGREVAVAKEEPNYMQMIQAGLFSYTSLDIETRVVVQQRTEEIKTLMRRTAQDIIDIGTKLIEVKERLGHGNFGGWLESEFGWTDKTARRFMSVADRFKMDNLSDLNIGASALYLLAAPSTPESARIETIDRAQNGEPITHKVAKQIVTDAKVEHIEIEQTEFVNGDSDRQVADKPIENHAALQGQTTEPPRVDEARHVESVWVEQDETSKPHVTNNSGNNEYTPAEYIEAARSVMWCIDLDPASSDLANETVKANKYYTIDDDGLQQEWLGRVWMNPPYAAGLIDRFAEKLAYHVGQGDVTEAIVLVNNATETAWFTTLVDVAVAVCFVRGRIRYLAPDGVKNSPLQGQAILYIGDNVDRFCSAFESIGWCAKLCTNSKSS